MARVKIHDKAKYQADTSVLIKTGYIIEPVRGICSNFVPILKINLFSILFNIVHLRDLISPWVVHCIELLSIAFLVYYPRHLLPQTSWTLTTLPVEPKYTAIVVVEGRVLAIDALFPKAKWMEEMFNDIAFLPLFNMAFPGSHHSGAYRRYNVDDAVRTSATAAYHQEEDVLTQLLYGVRFLDLRVTTS